MRNLMNFMAFFPIALIVAPSDCKAEDVKPGGLGQCSVTSDSVEFAGQCEVTELPNGTAPLPNSIFAREVGAGYAFFVTSAGNGLERVYWNKAHNGSYPLSHLGDAYWLEGCWRGRNADGKGNFSFCLRYGATAK